VEAEALLLEEDNPRSQSFLRLLYRGAQALAMLSARDKKSFFYIRQDDMWLSSVNAGKDVRFDNKGRSFVIVSETRLYDLVRNPTDSMHEMKLMPKSAGSSIQGFSFSDRCSTIAWPH
jgi:hypothetical protein